MNDNDIEWDLTEIFTSCDDPRIAETLDFLMTMVNDLISHFEGKISVSGFTAQDLIDLLKQYEDILAIMQEVLVYSLNSFRANTSLLETKTLYYKFSSFKSSIMEKLTFIEIEIGKLITENPQLLYEKILKNYAHYLEKLKRSYPFRLSKIEEELILEKDQHGVRALEQLRATWIGNQMFKANFEGMERIITRSETFPLSQHPNREIRRSVSEGMNAMLERDQEIYSSVIRNTFGNWVKNVKRRKYDSYIHQSLIDNDINQEILDNMINTIEDNIHIFQKFWKLKAKVLDLPKLEGFDIPAYLSSKIDFGWDEMKQISIHIFDSFDKSLGEIIIDMFERKHIDASSRDGKTDFVFCAPWYRGKTAFMLTSYKGLLSDLKALSHEFGHAIHWYLASKEQSYLNFVSPLIEVAPFFGELLLNDYLLSTVNSKIDKINLLTNQLNQVGYWVFWMTARMWCEQNLCEAVEKGEFLDGDTISKYWCAARDKIYGDSVLWSDDMKWEWVNFSFYSYPYRRFLNYHYTVAQLFVFALYHSYKQEKEIFVPKFKKFLRAGSSKSPKDLAKIFDLNINNLEIWNLGMNQYRTLVKQLEELTN